MPTLAPKLPWTHPFAGGYPRLGGQPLPTDPDAIDYLERVAAVEAPVEVSVAMAVDAFVRGCKADGIWSALKASCIMCGARTISGALVPLVGTAPTAYSFASGDYDRSSGLKGDGSTKYLDTNRANNADGQDDKHLVVYASASASATSALAGSVAGSPLSRTQVYHDTAAAQFSMAANASTVLLPSAAIGFSGVQISGATMSARVGGLSSQSTVTAVSNSYKTFVFARNVDGAVSNRTDARLAFYSIGSSLDLAALDNRVSTLVTAIAAAI